MTNTIIPKTMYAGVPKKRNAPMRKLTSAVKKTTKVPQAKFGNNFNMIGSEAVKPASRGGVPDGVPMRKAATSLKKAAPKAKKSGLSAFSAYNRAPKGAKEMVQRRMSTSKPLSTGGVYKRKR